MSSVYNPTRFPTINAVNNLTICQNVTYTTHSIQEHRPLIKIYLQSEYDVYRVAIFNLQGVYGMFVKCCEIIKRRGGSTATNIKVVEHFDI